jgi:hypothetical protein
MPTTHPRLSATTETPGTFGPFAQTPALLICGPEGPTETDCVSIKQPFPLPYLLSSLLRSRTRRRVTVILAGCILPAKAVFLQPMAFRFRLLRQILPAVPLFPSFGGTFQDEVSFRLQCYFPEDLASVSDDSGPKPSVFLRPCDSVVERTFPVFVDLLNIRDWSGTRFSLFSLRLS